MLNSSAPATQPNKITESATGTSTTTIPFRVEPARLPDIDDLAGAHHGYSPELAYIAAVISAWSYADEHVLASKLRYYGMRGAHVRRVTVQNNAMLVVTTAYLIQSASGKTAFLVFRGTDPGNFITILTDTQLMQRRFQGGMVHAGFCDSVEVVWDEVYEALDAARSGVHLGHGKAPVQLEHGLASLFVTGHSLGGAMGVLAASRLFAQDLAHWQVRQWLKGVYTFGQPMVGDAAFSEECGRRFGHCLFRHVYRNDVVAHLPPVPGLPYAHAGGERRAASLESAWAEHSAASKRARLLRATADVLTNLVESRFLARDLFGGLSIDDHAPANYLEVCRFALAGAANVRSQGSSSAPLPGRLGSAAQRLWSRATAMLG